MIFKPFIPLCFGIKYYTKKIPCVHFVIKLLLSYVVNLLNLPLFPVQGLLELLSRPALFSVSSPYRIILLAHGKFPKLGYSLLKMLV